MAKRNVIEGVIIPASNQLNLVLNDDVTQAVKQHKFHLYIVKTVDEAIDAVRHIKDIDRIYCRHHAERNFAADRMVKEYIKVYETVLYRTKGEGQKALV